jgi:hypothetical protein
MFESMLENVTCAKIVCEDWCFTNMVWINGSRGNFAHADGNGCCEACALTNSSDMQSTDKSGCAVSTDVSTGPTTTGAPTEPPSTDVSTGPTTVVADTSQCTVADSATVQWGMSESMLKTVTCAEIVCEGWCFTNYVWINGSSGNFAHADGNGCCEACALTDPSDMQSTDKSGCDVPTTEQPACTENCDSTSGPVIDTAVGCTSVAAVIVAGLTVALYQ